MYACVYMYSRTCACIDESRNDKERREEVIKEKSRHHDQLPCTKPHSCYIYTYPKRIQLVALEGIEEPDLADVGGDDDLLAVIAELESRPLAAGIVLSHVEGRKWALGEGGGGGGG